MICVIALVVFAIMGLYSATHRRLAKEAFDCVFRRVTFRPCRTNLNKRLKSQITGKIMRRNPRLAGKIYRRFELLSWIFTIILIVSVVFSVRAIYNLAVHGSCEPGGVCILTGTEEKVPCESEQCALEGCECIDCAEQGAGTCEECG